MTVRGITQLVRRLEAWGAPECAWSLRASHNTGEICRPGPKRKSVRVAGRRLARGSTHVPESVDYWSGTEVESRLSVTLPDGEACGELGE